MLVFSMVRAMAPGDSEGFKVNPLDVITGDRGIIVAVLVIINFLLGVDQPRGSFLILFVSVIMAEDIFHMNVPPTSIEEVELSQLHQVMQSLKDK